MTDPLAIGWPDPAAHPNHDAVRRWQAHLDARRLGANPPTPPAVAAVRDATTALFQTIAADRRTLDRAHARALANGEIA